VQALPVGAPESQPFNLTFISRKAAVAVFQEGNGTLRTGGSLACERTDHLLFDHPLGTSGERGLQVRMDNIGADCQQDAEISTGHLAATLYVTYGDFATRARIGHAPDGGHAPSNTFTCFSAYTDRPHNEIALCWPATTPTVLHLGYWVGWDGDKEHFTEIDLGFDATAALHDYRISWRPTSIAVFVDGVKVAHSQGRAGVNGTIPWRPLSTRVILRPKDGTFLGPAAFDVARASYAPA